jgi:hypothetical protein
MGITSHDKCSPFHNSFHRICKTVCVCMRVRACLFVFVCLSASLNHNQYWVLTLQKVTEL